VHFVFVGQAFKYAIVKRSSPEPLGWLPMIFYGYKAGKDDPHVKTMMVLVDTRFFRPGN